MLGRLWVRIHSRLKCKLATVTRMAGGDHRYRLPGQRQQDYISRPRSFLFRDALGGFFLVDAGNPDEAIEIAGKVPWGASYPYCQPVCLCSIAWSTVRNRLNHDTPVPPFSRLASSAAPFGRLTFLDSTHFTEKTSTSAHVVPCGGTATKYSFSSGTNKPVLPSGPVGIFPMAR